MSLGHSPLLSSNGVVVLFVHFHDLRFVGLRYDLFAYPDKNAGDSRISRLGGFMFVDHCLFPLCVIQGLVLGYTVTIVCGMMEFGNAVLVEPFFLRIGHNQMIQ